MPTVIPYVPRSITVHLGPPSKKAPNVTVSFPDYVKNVASSEIYPTWEDSALRANILAIVSFALNRVYTEFYPSRGYDFDITSSTAFDQAFVNGRSYFERISRMVNELFNDYLRRPGFVEPLAAKFCNGTTVTCDGLSQWGSQNLAVQGLNSTRILKSYYGNVEIVKDARVQGKTPSYPGTPLKKGSSGPNVVVIQTELNRISQNYPAIPKLSAVDGIFGSRTEHSVKAFQQVFDLNADGIVGKSTWYALVRLYTAVTELSELRSQGQQFYAVSWSAPSALQTGDRGEKVRQLQYMLSVLSSYIPSIPPVSLDGIYGPKTRSAVAAAQQWLGIPETGITDNQTWQLIYDQYAGIENTSLRSNVTFPPKGGRRAASGGAMPVFAPAEKAGNPVPPLRYHQTSTMTQFPGRDLQRGSQDSVRQEVVR